ncbi:MAG: hypothetical protein U0990_05480, partial [Candidatus Nanopelagicales bacterium]|nr:hypothetical protein [Candidatus Nanopelagicales bacterium]MDZ4249524.1 hypothetical protein [Candidatus Nanopelagicales bacterium]
AFQQHLANVIAASMGTAAASNVTIRIHAINGDDIARVHVRPSSFPVEATITVENNGQLAKKTAFFIRVANGTRELAGAERDKYMSGRWRD